MIFLDSSGSHKETLDALRRIYKGDVYKSLGRYGDIGVEALAKATPKDTGLTAASWVYSIVETREGIGIEWSNTNVNNGVNVAVLIQYGHGTGTGGYVVGIDYINPALKPIFDDIADEVWREIVQWAQ